MFVTLLDRLLNARNFSADRRGVEPREAVTLVVDAETGGRRLPIEIGNISSGGLMARAAEPVPTGARVALRLDGQQIEGEVRWSDEDRFGVRFDEPLQLDAVLIERYRPASIEANKVMSRWMV